MSDTVVAKCCRCSEEKECTLEVDPLLAEIYPEDGPYEEDYWCDDCLSDRSDER